MKKLHKKYKHNIKRNTLEITHNFVTDTNLKVTLKEIVEYTKKKEIELLKEIKEEISQKLTCCHDLLNQNISLKWQLQQEITAAGLSLLMNTPVALITCGVTGCLGVKDSIEFIKNSIEQNNLKKQTYYIQNESSFSTLDLKQITENLKNKKLKKKIEKLVATNSLININNVNNFSQKELKKINNLK